MDSQRRAMEAQQGAALAATQFQLAQTQAQLADVQRQQQRSSNRQLPSYPLYAGYPHPTTTTTTMQAPLQSIEVINNGHGFCLVCKKGRRAPNVLAMDIPFHRRHHFCHC